MNNKTYKPFPAIPPEDKPTDVRLSAAMQRLYDCWSPPGAVSYTHLRAHET